MVVVVVSVVGVVVVYAHPLFDNYAQHLCCSSSSYLVVGVVVVVQHGHHLLLWVLRASLLWVLLLWHRRLLQPFSVPRVYHEPTCFDGGDPPLVGVGVAVVGVVARQLSGCIVEAAVSAVACGVERVVCGIVVVDVVVVSVVVEDGKARVACDITEVGVAEGDAERVVFGGVVVGVVGDVLRVVCVVVAEVAVVVGDVVRVVVVVVEIWVTQTSLGLLQQQLMWAQLWMSWS